MLGEGLQGQQGERGECISTKGLSASARKASVHQHERPQCISTKGLSASARKASVHQYKRPHCISTKGLVGWVLLVKRLEVGRQRTAERGVSVHRPLPSGEGGHFDDSFADLEEFIVCKRGRRY